MCVHACCVCACMRACVCACMHTCVCVCVCVCELDSFQLHRVQVLMHLAFLQFAQYRGSARFSSLYTHSLMQQSLKPGF